MGLFPTIRGILDTKKTTIMSEVITLREYSPRFGFGVFGATGEDGSHFLIDMHISGTTEPFVSWADDTVASMAQANAWCETLVGRQFRIESRSPAMYYAEKGELLPLRTTRNSTRRGNSPEPL